jgi:hypothetical protein
MHLRACCRKSCDTYTCHCLGFEKRKNPNWKEDDFWKGCCHSNPMLEAELQKPVEGPCTVIVQLFDNSVYQVGGPGGVRYLPD